jgi:hypothetical protein
LLSKNLQFDKTSVGLQPENISEPNYKKIKHESDSDSHSIRIILSVLLYLIFVIAIVVVIYHYWNQRRIKETSSELLIKIICYKKTNLFENILKIKNNQMKSILIIEKLSLIDE